MEVKKSVTYTGISFGANYQNGKKSAFIAIAKSYQKVVFTRAFNDINVQPAANVFWLPKLKLTRPKSRKNIPKANKHMLNLL